MTRLSRPSLIPLILMSLLAISSNAGAQQQDDDAAVFKPAQPDFTLVGLPTGLRLPRFKSAFRVTHRFTRPLTEGDFGSLSGDFFGLDSGAQIVLQGPAALDVNSAWSATLNRGTIKASLPPEAMGFSIQNPTVEVVDLGTEFTMFADAGGASTDVLVLKGEVEAAPRQRGCGSQRPIGSEDRWRPLPS